MKGMVLDLPPGPRARGRAHGEALRQSIGAHLDIWMANLDGGRASDPALYLDRFATDTDFLPAAKRWTPDLIAEVEGIAEGAGQPLPRIWALQMLDEEWAYSQRCATREPRSKCSTFGIPGNGTTRPTLAGQNMDLGSYTDGFQVMLRLAADRDAPGALVFSLAGLVGLMGVNEAGLAVNVNTLAGLPSAATGLPVAFVMRGALARYNASDGADFISGVEHASGQHYLLADARTIISMESSAAGSARFAGQSDGRIMHTNHSLAGSTRLQAGNSVARLASLEQRLCAAGLPGVEDAKAALSSFDDPQNPVCRRKSEGSGLIGFTTGSMISTLAVDGPIETEIAFGPPSEHDYRRFTLERWSPARVQPPSQAGTAR